MSARFDELVKRYEEETNITAQLKNENLIYEKSVEERSARGRHRVLLAINPGAAYVVGVKVSAFKIGCALINILGEIKSATIIPVRTNERSVEFVADIIEEGIRHCIADARLTIDQISGIGLGIPGFIESRKGLCHWSPLHKQGDVQLRDLIERRFKIRTVVEKAGTEGPARQLAPGNPPGRATGRRKNREHFAGDDEKPVAVRWRTRRS